MLEIVNFSGKSEIETRTLHLLDSPQYLYTCNFLREFYKNMRLFHSSHHKPDNSFPERCLSTPFLGWEE